MESENQEYDMIEIITADITKLEVDAIVNAARWIAPSTPPPPKSEQFAALTMASTSSFVMSAVIISIILLP